MSDRCTECLNTNAFLSTATSLSRQTLTCNNLQKIAICLMLFYHIGTEIDLTKKSLSAVIQHTLQDLLLQYFKPQSRP